MRPGKMYQSAGVKASIYRRLTRQYQKALGKLLEKRQFDSDDRARILDLKRLIAECLEIRDRFAFRSAVIADEMLVIK